MNALAALAPVAPGARDAVPWAGGAEREPGERRGLALIDQRLRIISDTTFDALLVVDDERRYLQVNAQASELLGASVEVILSRRIENFTPPESRPRLEELWAQLREEGTLEGPYEVLRGDGSRSWIEFRASWHFAPGQHLIAARPIASVLVDSVHPQPGSPLSRREREVLQLAALGCCSQEIADALFITVGTVKSHFQHIYSKLEARDRAHAVALALRAGIIS